jgi:hypothetical protein
MTISNTTRDDILATIAQCDEMGEAAFLKHHGYGRSLRYQLRHQGQSYPSKAILGVASGLTCKQFSGGAAHTVRVLERLGFEVRDGKRKGVSGAVAALVALAASAWSFPALARPELPVEPVATFASGSNHAGEIRGWAALGHDVGVAAPELSEAAIVELEALAGSDVAVFVDSGAFSEVAFGPSGPRVVKAITDDEWRQRLGVYKRLGAALGSQLHVVAPDRVGDQQVTLERLERYADDLRELGAMGVHILVPVQRGAMSQADFMRAAEETLLIDAVPALPCKKAATSVEELAAFCSDYGPHRMHLLGLGARGARTRHYLAAVDQGAPGAQVTIDSCVIRAHCNRDRRIGVARRIALGLREAWTVAARKEFEICLAFGGLV